MTASFILATLWLLVINLGVVKTVSDMTNAYNQLGLGFKMIILGPLGRLDPPFEKRPSGANLLPLSQVVTVAA